MESGLCLGIASTGSIFAKFFAQLSYRLRVSSDRIFWSIREGKTLCTSPALTDGKEGRWQKIFVAKLWLCLSKRGNFRVWKFPSWGQAEAPPWPALPAGSGWGQLHFGVWGCATPLRGPSRMKALFREVGEPLGLQEMRICSWTWWHKVSCIPSTNI